MPQYSVLLVDDDPKIAKLLQSYFEKEDFAVFTALDGIAALQLFRDKKPDILVLDLMLPGMNGLDVCRQIRRENETPILIWFFLPIIRWTCTLTNTWPPSRTAWA